MVPNLKNTALIFPEIFVIECCTVLVELLMMSSLSSWLAPRNHCELREAPEIYNVHN